MDTNTEAAAGAALGVAAVAVDTFNVDDRGQFAVVPDGMRVESLEAFQSQPNRKKARRVCVDPLGFIGYVNRWGGADTQIAVNVKLPALRIDAALDFGTKDSPQHGDHTLTLAPRVSLTVQRWLNIAGKPMTQRVLAEFLEERAQDVSRPDAASIMDMVLTFEATKKVSFRSATRLQNGDRQLTYVEETAGGGSSGAVTIPDRITIKAPVFEGGAAQDITFLLRYSISDGDLTFTLRAYQWDETVEAAFSDVVRQVDEGLVSDVPRPFLLTAD